MRFYFCALLASVQAARLTHLGGFSCRAGLTAGPGFLSFSPDGTLIASQFTGDPLEQDHVSLVRGLDSLLSSGNVSAAACTSITSALLWPNFVDYFSLPGPGGVTGVLAPGGFLVPGKSLGAVSIVPVDFATGVPQSPLVLSTIKILPGDGWCAWGPNAAAFSSAPPPLPHPLPLPLTLFFSLPCLQSTTAQCPLTWMGMARWT